ncbi:hypothetical protein D1872_197660 [compost metagenome]
MPSSQTDQGTLHAAAQLNHAESAVTGILIYDPPLGQHRIASFAERGFSPGGGIMVNHPAVFLVIRPNHAIPAYGRMGIFPGLVVQLPFHPRGQVVAVNIPVGGRRVLFPFIRPNDRRPIDIRNILRRIPGGERLDLTGRLVAGVNLPLSIRRRIQPDDGSPGHAGVGLAHCTRRDRTFSRSFSRGRGRPAEASREANRSPKQACSLPASGSSFCCVFTHAFAIPPIYIRHSS